MSVKLDYLFLIPTYNRYDYLVLIIDKIIEQSENFNFKIAIVNDSSNDNRYDYLVNKYSCLIYHKNEKNNGKDGYYKTINTILNITKNNPSNNYIFLADDTLPSKKLISSINEYIKYGAKVVNIAIYNKNLVTNWGLDNWVDGGLAITHDILDLVNYELKNIVTPGYGTGVFREITLRLNKLNIRVHYPKHSLLNHLGHTDSVMHPKIRLKENIFSYSFLDDNKDMNDLFRDESKNLINQKIQLKVSDSVSFFKDKMSKKYNTIPYINKIEPVAFFGMYSDSDYKLALSHTGQKIIIWCGTDALNLKGKPNWWPELKKIVNISMSSFVKDSLNFCGIESEIIPITPTKGIINITPKGDNIYWYYSNDNRRDFYGGKIVDDLKKLTNYNILEVKGGTYNEDELSKIYEKCFIGLRLTKHDGLPNTVIEMGLMGRSCLHNGDTPNSIKYNENDIYEIINKIDYEYNNININNLHIAENVYKYISKGDDINKIFFTYDTIVNNKKIDIIEKNEKLKNKTINPNNNKKKSTTSSGNVIEPIIESKPIPQNKPEIKSQISSKPQKLFNPEIESKPKPEVKKQQPKLIKPAIEVTSIAKPIEPEQPIVKPEPSIAKPIEPEQPIVKPEPSIVKPNTQQIKSQIKSPIKPQPRDNQSKSSISRIPNDLDIGRLRKQRLNFGRR
jgi:hypothetical protein